jgi:hypothetical protein
LQVIEEISVGKYDLENELNSVKNKIEEITDTIENDFLSKEPI